MSTPVLAFGQERAAAAALRKAWRRLIPLLGICYLVAYMDRINISFAAEGMHRDLHLSARVYGLGAGLFFLSYAVFEIPANKLLLRFGPRRWLAAIMLAWGLLAAGMLLVRTPAEFYSLRLVLGVAEAGYFPGVIYYLTLWFPGQQRARAVSWFYVSLPLSSVVMGSAAGALLGLDGRLGLHGWQWLFLVEGLPAVVLAGVLWARLPDGPRNAAWLSEPERAGLSVVLRAQAGAHDGETSLALVLRHPGMWLLCGFCFCMLGVNYAASFFVPVVLRELTPWSQREVGWWIAGAGVAAAAAMVLNATHSDRRGERTWHTAIPMLLIAVLTVGAGVHLRGWGAAGALLLIAVAYAAAQGPLFALITGLFAGQNGALAIATINMMGMLGGFVGPYWMGWMRDWSGGYAVGIASLSVPCVAAAGCVVLLRRQRGAATSVQA